MAFFSVVIPLYNKEKYIQKAIQSVLDQSFDDFELIIINDGSKDESLTKIEAIKDKRIQIVNQENAGVSATRNKGVSLAKSEYIAFLDADDWWERDFLLEIKTLITNFPEAKIFASKYFRVKNGIKTANLNYENETFSGYLDYIKAYIFAWWMPLTSSSIVISKSVLEEMKGFNEKLKFGEDFELWIRIILKYKLAYTNKVLVNYLQDVEIENRAVQRKIWKKEEHFIFNLDFLNPFLTEKTDLKKLIDGLKVRSLHYFYRKGVYKNEVRSLLNSVDFIKQSFRYRFYYNYPFFISESYFRLKILASKIKQKLK
ncbi:MAG: glycosyltransferase family A protein [Bacteroidota bacterium]